MSRRRFPVLSLLAGISALFVLFALSGCGFKERVSTLDPKGPLAQMQLDLFMVTVWVTLFIFVTVGGALAWVVWRFREKKGDEKKPLPEDTHGNPLVEIGLIAASILLLVIIAIPTVEGIFMENELPAGVAEEDVIEVTVRGYQWWWAFEYEDYGITTGNELVIPVGKVVKLNLRGEDVIHSFWLPKIAGKVDLLPGRKNWMWIQADEVGHYYGQCAEFCGESHSLMLFRADVIAEEAFETWVANYQKGAAPPAGDDWTAWLQANASRDGVPADPIEHGASLFFGKGGCVQCHAIDGSPAMGVLGPNLTNVGSRASLGAGIMENRDLAQYDDEEIAPPDPERQLQNLYEWIAHSDELKPGNLMYKEGSADGFQRLVHLTPAEEEMVEAGEATEEELMANKLSEEEIMLIARYLQTLTKPL